MALTKRAHDQVRDHFEQSGTPLSTAVDATCGNGFDTEFLCRLGFRRVVGLDVQQHAIDITRHRLQTEGLNNFVLHLGNHAKMDEFVHEPIDCVMFNFGYLPHGDKSITTESHSSVHALQLACQLLGPRGIISALCYPGHEQGAAETRAIHTALSQLDDSWQIEEYLSERPSSHAPILYLLTTA